VAGVFLHRRLNRPNGGVAYRLANGDAPAIRGQVRLQEDEAADLRDGKFYVSVISRTDPRQSARGDIVSWD
jgi:hypothetical protein